MHAELQASADAMRAAIVRGEVSPVAFRAALVAVPPGERDAWVDAVLELDVPADGSALPRDGVPYLPSAVDAVLRLVELAAIGEGDVVVDVGAGVGRATTLVHLLTGCQTIGLEIQPALVAAARALAARLGLGRCTTREGDAAELVAATGGTAYFLYCPFSGARLERLLDALAPIATTRPIRIAALDLPLPARPWLARASTEDADLVLYRGVVR